MSSNVTFSTIAELDLDPIKVKLMHKESGEGWSREQVDTVAFEYRRFLQLVKMYPQEQVAPLFDVDIFWHYHILDTMKYAADCEQVFGYFLHHFPYSGLRGEDDEAVHEQIGARMQQLYEETFGVTYARQQAGSADGNVGTSAGMAKTAFSQPTIAKIAFSQPTVGKIAFSQPTIGKIAFSQPTISTRASSPPSAPKIAFSQPTIGKIAFSQPTISTRASSSPSAPKIAFSQPTVGKIAFSQPTVANEAGTSSKAAENEGLYESSMRAQAGMIAVNWARPSLKYAA